MAHSNGCTTRIALGSPSSAAARARTSCSRCHKRKKRCDRLLPSCNNCVSARVNCSFEDDNLQTASYPIAYIQGLEEKLRRLTAAANLTNNTNTNNNNNYFSGPVDHQQTQQESSTISQECIVQGPYAGEQVNTPAPAPAPTIIDNNQDPGQAQSDQTSSFHQHLTDLSLEAAAERHLGSTSGLSFARLTQMMLRRLTPDKADFVFTFHQENNGTFGFDTHDFSSPSDLFNDSFYHSLSESISIHPLLFGDVVLGDFSTPDMGLDSLAWPSDDAHVRHLVDFYFAHSHTLYPILNRSEVMDTLGRIRQDPQNLASQAPLDIFRIWMVLAIGSTAHSSVTLTEESESMLYYNKALQYSEQALGSDELSALEAIMLQVSYSFFNQLGPNTWFLVGTAARLALGMGLHTASTYLKYSADGQQRRKRLFFSIYMMDRVVSMTLGRPFAIHDDDIDATPFQAVDDDFIQPDIIGPRSLLQPSLMVIPLHILSLRRIASKISRQVYGNVNSNLSPPEREAVITSLHQQLLEWRRSMPFPLPDMDDRVPHLNTAWYDFNYYTHLALIYRPSPLFPVLDLDKIKVLQTAASTSLRLAFGMHQQRRFAYNWLNFLALFTATLSLVYAVTTHPDNLDIVLRQTRATDTLDLATQLFQTLSLKFVAAKKIRSMIADISTRYKELLAANGMESHIHYHG